MKNKLLYWLPVVLWALVIFAFSEMTTIPSSRVTWQEFAIKKSAHIFEYGVFAAFLYRGFINTGFDKARSAKYAFIISVLYGVSDEFHQSFTPGRTPTLRDVGFDTIGTWLALYISWKALPRYRESNKLFSIIYEYIYGKDEKQKQS